MNDGVDYQFVSKDNTLTEIGAIYNLKTDDSVVIYISKIHSANIKKSDYWIFFPD